MALDASTLYHLTRILEVPGGHVLVSAEFFAAVIAPQGHVPPNVVVSSKLSGQVAVRVSDDGAFLVIALDAAGERSAHPLVVGTASPWDYAPA